jgi:hypothetical protein
MEESVVVVHLADILKARPVDLEVHMYNGNESNLRVARRNERVNGVWYKTCTWYAAMQAGIIQYQAVLKSTLPSSWKFLCSNIRFVT